MALILALATGFVLLSTTFSPAGRGAAHVETEKARGAGSVATGWSKLAALPASYPTRWDSSFAYFPPSNQLVLFGGGPSKPGDPWWSDTWIFQSRAWTQGPTAPSGLTPRAGAAMGFDPDISKLVLFGGSGPQWPPYADTWLYDGTSWSLGPAAPPGLSGRSGAEIVYDPGIHRLVLFGGSGTAPYAETWLFDGTSWTPGPTAPPSMPVTRTYFGMTYDPSINRVVVVGGSGGTDVWYFDGSSWSPGPSLSANIGPKERVRLDYDPELLGDVLFGGIGPGTANGIVGVLRDGAWTSLTTIAGNAVWPPGRLDGGLVWNPALSVLQLFGGINANSKLGQTGYRDDWRFHFGLPAFSATAPAGGTLVGPVKGFAFDAGETVEIHVDSVTGPLLGTVTADSNGAFSALNLPIPYPFPGGTHQLFALGQTSRLTASGAIVTVTPAASIVPVAVAAGDSTTYSATGFVPGETVSVSFPAGTPVTAAADDTGSVTVAVVSPAEPYPGGSVTGSAPSASKAVPFTTLTRCSWPPISEPQASVPISGTGFSASESVQLRFDGGPVSQTFTADGAGSFSANAIMAASFGTHTLTVTGVTSGVTKGGPVTLPTWMTVQPTVGPPGTVVTVISGPGWVPGEKLHFARWSVLISDVTVDANSVATTLYTIPQQPAGLISFSLTSDALKLSAYATFQVTGSIKGGGSVAVGKTFYASGSGFGANETVDVRADSATGSIIGSVGVDETGLFPSTQFTVPTPFPGGTHPLFGVGRTTGTVATGASITVTPIASLSPSAVAAGDATVYSAMGFVPGETVSVAFPGGSPVTGVADATGSVSVYVVSPPEAFPSGYVTGTATSATKTAPYTVLSRASWPSKAEPGQQVLLSLTGFGPNETITVSFDSGPVSQSFVTDATGSLSAQVVMSTTFGDHTMTVVGASSSVSRSGPITLPALMSISPTSGPPGTVIQVTSGPGWVSGETIHFKRFSVLIADLTADASGSINTTYTVPQQPTGPITFSLTSDALGVSAYATFQVTASPYRRGLR